MHIHRNCILKSLLKAWQNFSAEPLGTFSMQNCSYCIMPPAYSVGASEKMMCSVRLRKHSHRQHRAMLGWAQQLWGGVMVKYAISSKI